MKTKRLDPRRLEAILFDFDGVLTDNRVYVDQRGRESVCCSRSDGMGFEVLRATSLKLFILSRERNPVVKARGLKLRVPVIQSVWRKEQACLALSKRAGFAMGCALFVGNDLNDYDVMKACGFSACPSDSHPKILAIADYVLRSRGGMGVVRELVEDVLWLDTLAYVRRQGKTRA